MTVSSQLIRKVLLPAVGLGVLSALAATPAAADGGRGGPTPGSGAAETFLQATLMPLNHSGARSTATAILRGDQLTISIFSRGLAPALPHAQHIHIGGRHVCPPPNVTGTGVHGHFRTVDGNPWRGPVAVSLTTSGDTSPASELAVARFPVGNATYHRTFTVTPAVAAQLRAGEGVIEQHGVDFSHNGRYDGPGRSELNPALPEEATDPAACGRLVPAADGRRHAQVN
ncbi:hypothetical protein E0F15_15325 [Frankia sp. B2]|uniref:hypothetical protein n=1 Tax=Frankia sp. B2 TaxID=2541730 RepID=UPI0004612561|nr:hypothetical protein [Frankia sp. B2]KDA42200.1 hypothetical protein BMG523Draft_02936 [Frankia sp. BMG5.23]ORT46875.1 hypothetical protein KBI5_22820 [Frankia sp. KB5]TFE28241.1 hypothetical protein E0F15_15325 [Frankia sp. B2]